MRIVMITGTYLPSINGVAIAVANLKKSLEKKGHEVLLFAPDNQLPVDSKEKNIFRYPSIANPINKDYPIPLLPVNAFFLKSLGDKKPDIVHVHHAYHIGYFAKLIADKYKVPLVFTYHTNHDLYAKKYAGFLSSNLRDIFLNNTVYEFCKKTDLVITPAEHTTLKLKRKIQGVNVITIQSPINFARDLSSKTKLAEFNLIKETGKKIVLTVSRLSKEKNIDLLIKSIRFLPASYILLIAGDGPERVSLENLTAKLKLQKRAKFLGRVDHDQLPYFYKLANVFAFTSDTETQGLVFLEAMQFGLPVVAVSSGSAKEFLSENFAEIVDNNPKKFAEGIIKVNKLDRKSVTIEEKNILKKYSPEKMITKLEDAYLRTIKAV